MVNISIHTYSIYVICMLVYILFIYVIYISILWCIPIYNNKHIHWMTLCFLGKPSLSWLVEIKFVVFRKNEAHIGVFCFCT